MLANEFGIEKINKSINVDEAVACGAAIYSSILANQKDEKTKNLVLLDVTPLALGVELDDNSLSVVVPKNTKIPLKKDKGGYTTIVDNQVSVLINVY